MSFIALHKWLDFSEVSLFIKEFNCSNVAIIAKYSLYINSNYKTKKCSNSLNGSNTISYKGN